MNKKPESVQGYLASPKLLSSINKQQVNKSKLNKSKVSNVQGSSKKKDFPDEAHHSQQVSSPNDNLYSQSFIINDPKRGSQIDNHQSHLHGSNLAPETNEKPHKIDHMNLISRQFSNHQAQPNESSLSQAPSNKNQKLDHMSLISRQVVQEREENANRVNEEEYFKKRQEKDPIATSKNSDHQFSQKMQTSQVRNLYMAESQQSNSRVFQERDIVTANKSIIKKESPVISAINSTLKSSRYDPQKVESVESRTPKVKSNPEVLSLQCYDLIRKLTAVKQELQLQISQLQQLLDHTSKYMENIDDEYLKIKKHIMEFVSRSLDNSFKEYKNSMVDWTKYEDIERKGIEIVQEISNYVEEEEALLKSERVHSMVEIQEKTTQLQKQISHYSEVKKEISSIRSQCLEMRPGVTHQGISQLEKALKIIGQF